VRVCACMHVYSSRLLLCVCTRLHDIAWISNY